MIEYSNNVSPFVLRIATEPLLDEHWQEVAKNKELMKLNPDWDKYRELDEAGKLTNCIAVDGGGSCVGYTVNFIVPHVHYKDLMVAYNDVIYLSPEYRASRVALRLMQETSRTAKAAGAQLLLWHAKPGTALDLTLAKRVAHHENVYAEKL